MKNWIPVDILHPRLSQQYQEEATSIFDKKQQGNKKLREISSGADGDDSSMLNMRPITQSGQQEVKAQWFEVYWKLNTNNETIFCEI